MGPLLELVKVPLDSIPSHRCVNCTTQLGVTSKLVEGVLDPTLSIPTFIAPFIDRDQVKESEELIAFLNPFLGIYELWQPGSEWFIIMNKLMNNSEPLMEITLSNFPSGPLY